MEKKKEKKFINNKKLILWVVCLLIMGLIIFSPTPEGLTPEGQRAIAIIVLAAFVWLGELLPLAAGALLIIVSTVLFKTVPAAKAFSNLGNNLIYLYIGGFTVAASMSVHGLDKRIAMWFINIAGTSKRRVLFGLMMATMFISWWVSSVIVTVAMLPITIGLLEVLEVESGDDVGKLFMYGMLLGSLTGGFATPVGTAANAVAIENVSLIAGIDLTFAGWMAFGVPIAVLTTLASYWLLVHVVYPTKKEADKELEAYVRSEYKKLGKMKGKELHTAIGFIIFSVLLLAMPFGEQLIGKGYWPSGMVAVVASMYLFFTNTLTWKQAQNGIAWHLLLLFAAGLTISTALGETQSGIWLANTIATAVPKAYLPLAFALFSVAFTQMTSNTATGAILIPIAANTAVAAGIEPFMFVVPVTLAISHGWLTPIGGAPNPIVFGPMPNGKTYLATTMDYVKSGWLPMTVSLAITLGWMYFIHPMF